MRTPIAAVCLLAAAAPASIAATTPAILTSQSNKVPACVTPAHLMALLEQHNKALPAKLRDIATIYKRHGEELHVRWDYAFYQMLVETNYLKFYAPNGHPGDVSSGQNNFAGLGATGHRNPGESFASVDTGVLAHLQHVRLYSGDPVENPVAERTRLVTDLILPWAQSFKRPVTFTDLTHKWAPSGHSYADAIEGTAEFYRKAYCNGAAADVASADTNDETVQEASRPAAISVPAAKQPKAAARTVDKPARKQLASAGDNGAEATLSGPALKKPANLIVAPVDSSTDAEADAAPTPETENLASSGAADSESVANDESGGDATKPTTRRISEATVAAPAKNVVRASTKIMQKTVGKAVVATGDEIGAVAGEAAGASKPVTAKLSPAATIMAPVEPALPDPDTADAGSDQPPIAINSDEGDGGAIEATPPARSMTTANAAKVVKKALVAASAGDLPLMTAKAENTEAKVATQVTTETAASNTQLASLTVPANPAVSKNCKVFTASYGGGMSLLIQSPDGERTRLTALTVNEAKAESQAKAFINVYAKGGQKIGSFGTQNEALTKAFQLCPEG